MTQHPSFSGGDECFRGPGRVQLLEVFAVDVDLSSATFHSSPLRSCGSDMRMVPAPPAVVPIYVALASCPPSFVNISSSLKAAWLYACWAQAARSESMLPLPLPLAPIQSLDAWEARDTRFGYETFCHLGAVGACRFCEA